MRPDVPAERRQIPVQVRAAPVRAQSFDAEQGTVEVVWTAGAKVRRMDWWTGKRYDEELVVTDKSIRLGRLNGGAPLLDTHGSWELRNVIGVVERAWLEKGEGRALLRFSGRDEVAPIVADVKADIIRNVSVGYVVHRYEITKNDNGPDLWRAVDWEPMELSLVPIGADPGAGVRSAAQGALHPCEFVETRAAAHTQESMMTDEEKAAAAEAARKQDEAGKSDSGDKPATPTADAAAEAQRAEAARKAVLAHQQEVRTIAGIARLGDEWIKRHVEAGTALDQVRQEAMAEMAKRSEEGGEVRTHTRITRDERDSQVQFAINAVMHRCFPATVKLEDGAREFRGLTLIELARDCLERRGISTRGMGRFELAGTALGLTDGYRASVLGAQGTSDLANILANVMNKTLRQQYDGTPRTFTVWARRSTNPDFKTISRTILSGSPSLLAVDQSGEFKRGAVTDGKETYQLATFGRTVAFSRQAIINDDLNALTRLPQLFGQAAADLESDTVYAVLTANAALADGVTLFHASSHGGNLITSGAAPDVTTLGVGRKVMRLQTGLEGRLINLVPRFLLAPAALEQVVYQYTSANYVPATASAINEFRAGGRTALEPVIEPRLDAASATAWYLAADPATVDTVEYCYLEGNEGVYTETRVGFEVDGVEMKVRHDFAAKALDYRGLFQNDGAT